MGWWSKSSEDDSSVDLQALWGKIAPFVPDTVQTKADDILSTPWTTNHTLILGTTCAASFLVGLRLGRIRPVWRAVTSLQDLASTDIGSQAPWMRGTVVSVSDGDTIRFLHRPTWLHSATTFEKSHRLALRLCTIDTPETAKFGKEGQPWGPEAKEHLKKLCAEQTVRVKILQIDQYGRGVAEVIKPGWLWNTHLDEAMLKAGLAEVYQGSGAVYGRLGKENYLQIMEKARQRKIGIWSDPNRETAAEYKHRTK
jgi:endonuclease YncB( thermonuclease family)